MATITNLNNILQSRYEEERARERALMMNQSAIGSLGQGLSGGVGGLLGQAASQLQQSAAYAYRRSMEGYEEAKPILGLDKGEKARSYLQRKIDGWLSGIDI